MFRKKILVIGLSGESIFLACDHFNKIGETIIIDEKSEEPGGKGFNQALALGKINANINFITILGNNNIYNKIITDTLINNGVNVYPIYLNGQTAYAVIQTNKNGENNVSVYSGVNESVKITDFSGYFNLIKSSDIILLQLELPIGVIKYLIDYAFDLNKIIILNPAPAKFIDNNILEKVTYLIPNEFELKSLANSSNIITALKHIKTPCIVCTRGGNDIIYKEEKMINYSSINKVNVIDTTGAGDIFSAFFTYFIQEKTFEESIKLASIASSYSVTKKGVVNAIPNLNQIIDN